MDKKTELIKMVLSDAITEEMLNNAIVALQPGKNKGTAFQDPFLTEKEACDYCGNIARSTLWNWRRAGLQSHQVQGRRLFRASDLERFITNQSMEACHE